MAVALEKNPLAGLFYAAAIISIAFLPSGALAASSVVRVSVVVAPHCLVARTMPRLTCDVASEPAVRLVVQPNASGELVLSIDP